MSDSDSEFEVPSENTRLMDGHVATNSTDVRNVTENTRKRRLRSPNDPNYEEVSLNLTKFSSGEWANVS